MDGVPLIVFSGQVVTGAIGSDAFQEVAPIPGKISKHWRQFILIPIPGRRHRNLQGMHKMVRPSVNVSRCMLRRPTGTSW